MILQTRIHRALRTYVLALFAVGITVSAAAAQTVEAPRTIGSTNAQNPTLGIPRWKGYVDPADTKRLWVCYANDSSSGNNVRVSEDGGLSWSTNDIHPYQNGYLNYHVAVFGKGGDVFFAFPGNNAIRVRRLVAPALSDDDRAPLVTLAGTGDGHRSNMMVDGNGRIWVITRRGTDAPENVLYQYSDDDGVTWTRGKVVQTGTPNVRVGCMPYVDGRACVVVLNLQSDKGYEYYLWNGTAFEARADYSINPEYVGYERAFTHNTRGGSDFHLVFGAGDGLHHIWKDDNDPASPWQRQVLATSAAMDPMAWSPVLTTRGDELYLFYSRWNTDVAASEIYMRRLTGSGGQWGAETLVSTGGTTHNGHPNTSFSVPVSADYIPIFWTGGAGQESIRFTRILVDPVDPGDAIPPQRIDDLLVHDQPVLSEVEVTWTAPGDDLDQGTAVSYDLRYSQQPLNEVSWERAYTVPNEPAPAPAGTRQYMTITGLNPGQSYLIGIRAQDDAGNDSGVSNVIWLKVGDLSATGDVPSNRATLQPNYPNPFNPATTLRFSLPHAGHVRLAIYDGGGRLVKRLLGEWRGDGAHEVRWNGRDRRGLAVASGTYFSRLEFEDVVTTGTLTLVR